MLDTIRRWLGATRRERELEEHCGRKAMRIAADAEVHARALAVLREQLEKVIAERDEARAELKAACEYWDAVHCSRDALRAECKRSARRTIKDLVSRHDVIMRQIERDMTNWSRIAGEMIEDMGFDVKAATDAAPPAEEAKP